MKLTQKQKSQFLDLLWPVLKKVPRKPWYPEERRMLGAGYQDKTQTGLIAVIERILYETEPKDKS